MKLPIRYQSLARKFGGLLVGLSFLLTAALTIPPLVDRVGMQTSRGTVIPVGQPVLPQGLTVFMNSRPVQVQLMRDGSGILVLENNAVSIYDLPNLKFRQRLPIRGGASMTGLAQSGDGKLVAASGTSSSVSIGALSDGHLAWNRELHLPAPAARGAAYPCGISWTPDDKFLFVAASRSNQLLQYSTSDWSLVKSFAVDPAPFEVDTTSPGIVYVTCWSSSAAPDDEVADASGTKVPVDERGIVKGASIDRVSLIDGSITKLPSDRQPSNLASMPGGGLVVPCANGDSLELLSGGLVTKRIDLSPSFGFESSPTWASYSPDLKTLAVSIGRANKLALFKAWTGIPKLDRTVDTGWYPSCVISTPQGWVVACPEGDGQRGLKVGSKNHSVGDSHGCISLIPYNVKSSSPPRARPALAARPGIAPVPIPERDGEPSLFHHVVFILKENRTYDQVFGDLPQGDGDPSLCDYPRKVTPNHHKLAEQFALLDNYYCNGILSADGHAWGMEANATSYFERTFGGWTRSYPYGDDPLSVSSTGFIWNDILAHGKSFRNYGEFDYASPIPGGSWLSIYKSFKSGENKYKYKQNIGVASLRKYTREGYPGWNLGIPDVVRASVFLDDLKNGPPLADFTIVYLPNDHTSGNSPGVPTPASYLADNDLALGQVIAGISHSPYWKDTCIIANEDDPQAGYDHVDGHRSLCIVASPYTPRRKVISDFYNQTSVLRTIERILGVPPLNRMDSESPIMFSCFNSRFDPTPYDAVPNTTPLDDIGRGTNSDLNFSKPDLNNELAFNRILWSSAHPGKPYPDHLTSRLATRGLVAVDQSKEKDRE